MAHALGCATQAALSCSAPRVRRRRNRVAVPCQATSDKPSTSTVTKNGDEKNPENPAFRVNFVGGIPTAQLTSRERQQRMMADLAVVNSRLAGNSIPPHAVRQKVESIQRQRRTWDLVYEYLSGGQDVTLESIEAANELVRKLVPVSPEQMPSVGSLGEEAQKLQEQLAAAQLRTRTTEARVEENMKRLEDLEKQVAALEACRAQEALEECDVSMLESDTPDVEILNGKVSGARKQRMGLSPKMADASSLENPSREDPLRRFWYPVMFTSKATDGYTFWFFDEQYTIRSAPAESGCPWVVIAPDGRRLPTCIEDRLIICWAGEGEPDKPKIEPGTLLPPAHYDIHTELIVEDIPVEWGLLVENLLDLAHAPFTHTARAPGTFAKGWSVPNFVQFVASRVRQAGDGWTDLPAFLNGSRGNWNPYPIDMAFVPPNAVLSHVGLAQAGAAGQGAQFVAGSRASDCDKHLHQLHVNVPARAGRTRLLYRMGLDFAGWAKAVPGMQLVWAEMANQVLGEDLRLVEGQQDRMARGGRVWAHPVGYDKCALAYRRWRNMVQGVMSTGVKQGAAAAAGAAGAPASK